MSEVEDDTSDRDRERDKDQLYNEESVAHGHVVRAAVVEDAKVAHRVVIVKVVVVVLDISWRHCQQVVLV
jgi:hypothetical protein